MDHDFINVCDIEVQHGDRYFKRDIPQYTIEHEFRALIQGMQAYVEIDLVKLGLTDDRM